MKPLPSSEHDGQDEVIIRLLKDWGSGEAAYPIESLTARRAAYLEQVEKLITEAAGEELSPADQEIVTLLGTAARSPQADYPADLLVGRHSAFVRQIQTAGHPSVADGFRLFLRRIFPSRIKNPALLPAGFMRLSLVTVSLIFALFLGSLFNRPQPTLSSAPLQAALTPTAVLPTSTSAVASANCQPDDQNSACRPENWDPGQDLADSGNGAARPAVSNDAYAVHTVKYVNDGRADTSWVSKSADSWIKIDLGQTKTINMVSLEKGHVVSAYHDDPGGFVISVALSDVYADGDSQDDDQEYAQVFHSEGADAGDTVSDAGLISTHFSPVEARFVKITFEREGAAIGEVRVFMAAAPVLAEQPTRIPRDDPPGIPSTPIPTNTLLATDPATSVPSVTSIPSDAPTDAPTTTAVPSQTPTNPPDPSDTPTELPTDTPLPTDTATPAPILLVLPTEVPPTAIEPTAIPSTAQPFSASTKLIVITESDQSLTFTCKGNAVEIRGRANTVILLGSCSSITVAGRGNHVFWQYGSPVISVQGDENVVRQLVVED